MHGKADQLQFSSIMIMSYDLIGALSVSKYINVCF